MSTLKTNNIEHLDASTPSIQTTIGGGTILAGVSTVSGTLNVGTGITFNTDGSATFADTVENGSFDSSLDTGKGCKLAIGSNRATINVQHSYTASDTANAFAAYKSPGSGQTPVRTFTIFGDGSAEFAGNITLSTAGTGIDFSATSDGSGTSTSELFDDYEEGTWTPSIATSGAVHTYSTQTGTYTKIGNIVYITMALTVDTTSANGGTSIFRIQSLPFTTISSARFIVTTNGVDFDGTAYSHVGYLAAGDQLRVLRTYDNGNQSAADGQDFIFAAGDSMLATGWYTVS